MRQSIKWLIVGITLCVASVVSAANWPQLHSRLQQWSGEKEVVLPAGVDPMEDEVLAPVVELLLEQGYVVLPAGSSSANGLSVEVRDTSHGKRLLLKRATDGALLAMEKLAPAKAAAPVVLSTQPQAELKPELQSRVTPQLTPISTTATKVELHATPTRLSVQHPPQPVAPGEVMFDLDGTPLQIVTWSPANGGKDIYLLYDGYIQHLRYDGRSLQLLEKFNSPLQPVRALHLDVGDMDQDGSPELAVVWAEDIRGVADATNTVVHSWVLSANGQGMQAISADLGGYLSLKGSECLLQRRQQYKAFAPQVSRVELKNGQISVGSQPVTSMNHLLFNQLQWPDDERALVWNEDQRLMLVARDQAKRIPGSTLLTDFGLYQGVTVSVPLREPEYRSGFSASDRIMARDFTLNRRLVNHGDDVFTIVRGRSEGLPVVGHPSGADRLVDIHNNGDRLSATYPFAQVEAFIVDFSITDNSASQAALLLNEKADGSGRAYLRVQKSL